MAGTIDENGTPVENPTGLNEPTSDSNIEALKAELAKAATGGGIVPALIKFLLNAAGGSIPFVGGAISAGISAFSEREQESFNKIFASWLRLQHDEMAEMGKTLAEVFMRLDKTDEQITNRIQSREYLSLIRKAFRDWSAAESEDKRVLIRNLLANAAASKICKDDIVRLFIEWIGQYSEQHFKVIGVIYNHDGITRGQMWRDIGEHPVREDSAEADLFKLLIRDLSTGGIIRQHRETDYYGNFVNKGSAKRQTGSGRPSTAKSAFDENDGYELTELGKQFVHYTMSDLPLKISNSKET